MIMLISKTDEHVCTCEHVYYEIKFKLVNDQLRMNHLFFNETNVDANNNEKTNFKVIITRWTQSVYVLRCDR